MTKIQYQNLKISERKLSLILAANEILDDYARKGYEVTLRQLYYQFIQRNWLPNHIRSYALLKDAINDGRLAGLVDWNHIVDITRNLRGTPNWPGPRARMKQATAGYRIDMWRKQPVRPEVWIEKDALLSIIGPVCLQHRVDYFSCRGFTSQSSMKAAGDRFAEIMSTGQDVHVIYLGDHDPSGVDMSRDIESRLLMYLEVNKKQSVMSSVRGRATELLKAYQVTSGNELRERAPKAFEELTKLYADRSRRWGKFTFERIALTMNQINELRLPPNPAKLSDSRARKYIQQWGDNSWELDALPPEFLENITISAILRVRDEKIWTKDLKRESHHRQQLMDLTDNFDLVLTYLEDHSENQPASERGSLRGRALKRKQPNHPDGS